MGVSIRFVATFELTCMYKYGDFTNAYSRLHIYRKEKRWECAESVSVDGIVYIEDEFDIDSIPFKMNIVNNPEYELPDGWRYGDYGKNVICPNCARELKL